MSCWALVPLKPHAQGKTRLAEVLSAQRRIELVRELFDHVIDTLRQVPEIAAIVAVGPEPGSVAEQVQLLPDTGDGLNASLSAALRTLESRGARFALIVHADLPLLCEQDVQDMIAGAAGSGLAIAPDRHGQGTNALCLSLPSALPLRFGQDSFRKHLAEAAMLNLKPEIVRSQGLGFDLDEPDDWALLLRMKHTLGVVSDV